MEEEIKKILENHEKRIKELEKNLVRDEKQTTKKHISIKEFILTKKPGSVVQKTLLIGYYIEKYENFDSFNVKDLEDCFRRSKEPVPKNINDMINKNIKNGHMMEAKEKKDMKKAWVLTASGERFVENGFKKE